MLTHDFLSAWFEDLRKIIFDSKIAIDNIKRITHPIDEIEDKVLKHGFFSHYYFQSRFTIVVQLCKIFDKNNNQKRNFNKLFNQLSSEKYDKELNEILKENEISGHLFANREDIVREVKSLTNEIETQKETIKKIIILRNNLYAHSDPDLSVPNVSNQELENLINLAIRIYNNLYGKLYDTTLLFNQTTDWKVDYPIKALAKMRRERLK